MSLRPYYQHAGITIYHGDVLRPVVNYISCQGRDTSNRLSTSPRKRDGARSTTHGRAITSSKSLDAQEHSEDSQVSELARTVEASEPNGITQTGTLSTTNPPTSQSSVGNATCEEMDASQQSRIALPTGLKPYYNHKGICIIHGDCREVLPLLQSVDLVVADPPYNVSANGGRHGFRRKVFLDETWDAIEDYAAFSKEWMDACRAAMTDKATMYVWGYHRSFPQMPLNEWYQLNLIVWQKVNAFPNTMQHAIWSPSCEFAYFLRKNPGKDHTFHIGPDDFARDIFSTISVTNGEHPSEKPQGVISEFIRRSTNESDLVLDPFMGSGTTLRAAKDLGRRAIGIEIEEKYCEIAVKRLSQEVLDFST